MLHVFLSSTESEKDKKKASLALIPTDFGIGEVRQQSFISLAIRFVHPLSP